MDTLIVCSHNHFNNIDDDYFMYQVINGKQCATYSRGYYQMRSVQVNRFDFTYEKHVTLDIDKLYIVRSKEDIIPNVFLKDGSISQKRLEKALGKRIYGIVLFDVGNDIPRIPNYYPIAIFLDKNKCIKNIKVVTKRVSYDNKERKWLSVQDCSKYKLLDCINSASCSWNVDKRKMKVYQKDIENLEAQNPLFTTNSTVETTTHSKNHTDDIFANIGNIDIDDKTLMNNIRSYEKKLAKLEDKTFGCKQYIPYRTLHLKSLSKVLKPYKYYIFSQHQLDFDNIMQQEQSYKPKGLWFAIGSEWLKYILANNFRLLEYNYLYEIELNHEKIFKISSLKDLKMFAKAFKVEHSLFGYGLIFDDINVKYYIDWKKMSRTTQKSGILIDQNFKTLYHQFDSRHNIQQYFKEIEWYLSWDVASGAIWNQDAIQDIQLLYKKEKGTDKQYRKKKTH